MWRKRMCGGTGVKVAEPRPLADDITNNTEHDRPALNFLVAAWSHSALIVRQVLPQVDSSNACIWCLFGD